MGSFISDYDLQTCGKQLLFKAEGGLFEGLVNAPSRFTLVLQPLLKNPVIYVNDILVYRKEAFMVYWQ